MQTAQAVSDYVADLNSPLLAACCAMTGIQTTLHEKNLPDTICMTLGSFVLPLMPLEQQETDRPT
jgi:hypothetical protein